MLTRLGPNAPLVVGLALSLSTGILFYFYATPGYLGLLVGLLGTAISLLIEVIFRMEREAKLRSQLEGVPWLRASVADIAGSLVTISCNARLLPFMEYAQNEVRDCAHAIAGMASGQMRALVGDDVLVRQTDAAQRVIRACGVQTMDVPRWLSDLGVKYWEANERALARNVRIERVFLYESWTAELEQIVAKQAVAGVHVWVALSARTDPLLRVDMAVWDDAFTYHFELNSEGEPIQNIYSVNEVDIGRRLHQMELLKSVAKPYVAGPSTNITG